MTDRLPPDQPARDAIRQRLDVTMLVEAAAGTGKTTNLVRRMVNLVLTGRASASTIAAITFTVKAAAHLREQFQRGIENAEAQRAQSDVEDSANLRAAAVNSPVGFIGTTHAFCARLLRERPVEAGLDPEFKEVDEAVSRAMTADFWNRWYDEKSIAGDRLIDEAKAAGLDRQTLRAAFEMIVGHPDVVMVSERRPRPDLTSVVRELDAFLDRVEPHLPTDAHRDEPDEFEKLMVNLLRHRTRADLTDPFDQVALLDEADHGSRKPVQKRWPDKQIAKRLGLDYQEFVKNRLKPVLRAGREHVHGIALDLLRPAAAEFAEERRVNGTLTFEDLLVCARDMLRDHPNVRRYFQRRFTHVLVDEFQDTDPVQAEVLMYLTGAEVEERNWRKLHPGAGSLFIVGDPKQSIYRFRRADITTYLEVKKQIRESGGEVQQLFTSFRSVPAICTFVNDAFKTMFRADDVAKGWQAEHVDLTAFGEATPRAGVFSLETAPGKNEEMARAEAELVGRWIRRQVEEKSLRWRDVLLVSWQTPRLGYYAHVFETLGVPYEITGSRAFKGLPDLRDVMPLLRAIVTPEDEVSIVAYLRGPLCGLDDDTLYNYRQSGGRFSAYSAPSAVNPAFVKITRALQTIAESIEDAKANPPAAAIARLFDRLGLIPRAASADQPGTRAGNLMLALSIARDLSAVGEPLASIVESLESMLEDAPDTGELDVDPSRVDAVRLMNLHQVKGLEAPVVFLIDPSNGFDFPVNLFVDRTGEESRGHFLVSRKRGQGPPTTIAQPVGWEAFEATEREFRRAEKMRLLYVASTRAMEMLVVGYRTQAGRIRGAWSDLAERIRTRFPVQPPAPEHPPPAPVRREDFEGSLDALQSQFTTAREPSYSVLPITKVAHASHVELVKAEEGLGKGTSWGRVLHRLFEALLRDESLDVRLYADNLLKDEERDPVEVSEVLRVVEAVRASSLWARVKAADERYVEIPFALTVPRREVGLDEDGDTLLHGTIDLVFREGERWYIVDYKSDSTEGRLDQLVEYYRPQVEHYAKFWSTVTRAPATAGLFFVDATVERWLESTETP